MSTAAAFANACGCWLLTGPLCAFYMLVGWVLTAARQGSAVRYQPLLCRRGNRGQRPLFQPVTSCFSEGSLPTTLWNVHKPVELVSPHLCCSPSGFSEYSFQIHMIFALDHVSKGEQNRPPQNVPLWHVHCFEPKAVKTQPSQEKLCSLPQPPERA